MIPILDHRTIKFHCLQAYILVQLDLLEEAKKQGRGKDCINKDNIEKEIVIEACEKVAKRIKANGNTYETLDLMQTRLSYVQTYYDCIGKTIKKHFEVGDAWIPSLLALSMLQEYTLRGHKGFEDLDFNNLLSGFEGVEDNNVSKHFKCAFDVVETLVNKKHKRQKRIRK